MNLNDNTSPWNATSTSDLQDIAALDRLAGQLAPQATLRRYARQHQANGSGPDANGGWQRLLAAVRHFYAEQKHLHELYLNRNDVSGGDALAAGRAAQSRGDGLPHSISSVEVSATRPEDRRAA